MGKKVFKSFKMYDLEAQEKWLNEMADKGLALTKIGAIFHEFEECAPGEYTIRFICPKGSPTTCPEAKELLEMMTESGAEPIITQNSQIYWFRRKRELGEFEIFSDLDSRISHLKRIEKIPLGIVCMMVMIILCTFPSGVHSNFETALLIADIIAALIGLKGYINIHTAKKKLIKQREITEN